MAFSTELLLKAMEEERKILEILIFLNSRMHRCSYVKLFMIAKSIVSCVILYALVMFKMTRIVLKKVIQYLQIFSKFLIKERYYTNS